MSIDYIQVYQARIGCSIESLGQEIEDVISKNIDNFKIFLRIKNIRTLHKKMVLKNVESVFLIDDVYGIRILVHTVENIYIIAHILTSVFSAITDHDYIQSPKTRPNDPALDGKMLRLLQLIGYRNEVPFEIQITTFEFHESNEELHRGYHLRQYGE